jgi:hypothetical protein
MSDENNQPAAERRKWVLHARERDDIATRSADATVARLREHAAEAQRTRYEQIGRNISKHLFKILYLVGTLSLSFLAWHHGRGSLNLTLIGIG